MIRLAQFPDLVGRQGKSFLDEGHNEVVESLNMAVVVLTAHEFIERAAKQVSNGAGEAIASA